MSNCLSCALYVKCSDKKKSYNYVCDRFKEHSVDQLSDLFKKVKRKEDYEESVSFAKSGDLHVDQEKDKKERYQVRKFVNQLLEEDRTLVPKDLKVDDGDFPLSKNFFDFTTSGRYLAKGFKPFPKQLETSMWLLSDFCPICSDMAYARAVPVDADYGEMKDRIKFFVHGRCLKCGMTRSKAWKKGYYKRYDEAAGLVGQRCITGDALVATEDGFKRVIDMCPMTIGTQKYRGPGVVIEDGSIVYPSEAMKVAPEPLISVLIKSGFTIKGTKDHPIMTDKGWRKLGEMTADCKIPVTFGQNIWGSNDLHGQIRFFNFASDIPEKEKAKYVARAAANILFCTADEPVLNTSRTTIRCKKAFVAGPSIVKSFVDIGFGAEYINTSNEVAIYAERHNDVTGLVVLSGNQLNIGPEKPKRIPSYILGAQPYIVCEFINELLSTSALKIKKQVGEMAYSMPNKVISRETQILLANFGIKTHRVGSLLYIQRESVVTFVNFRNGILPVTKPETCYHSIFKINRDIPPEPTYDFTIPDKHRFMANGILNHNSGKSLWSSLMAGYTLHRFLKLQDPPRVYGLMPNQTLQATFVATLFRTAKANIYMPFHNLVSDSPWFSQYHQMLDHFSNKRGDELYKFKDTFFHYKHRHLAGYVASPDSRFLRGDTRFLTVIDEIGYLISKCLVGSSLVPTDKGILTLEEMRNESKGDVKADGFLPYKVLVKTHTNEKRFTNKTYKTKGKTIEVKTVAGEKVEGLPEHKLWVLKDDKMQFVRLDELTDDIYLPKSVGTNLFPKEAPTINFVRHTPKNARIQDDFIVPKKLTVGIATLFGLFVAEGCRAGSFSNHDPLVLNLFQSLLKKEFGSSRPMITSKDGRHIGVSLNKHLQEFFNHHLGEGLSQEKTVPYIIRTAPKKYQTAFLRGLFEGDGCVCKQGNNWIVHHCCVSESLARQVKAMLENMGILCNLQEAKLYTGNTAYKVFIYTESFEAFYKEVGFLENSVKTAKLKKALLRKTERADAKQTGIFGGAYLLPATSIVLKLYEELESICKSTTYTFDYIGRSGKLVTTTKRYKLYTVLHDSHFPARLRKGYLVSKKAVERIVESLNHSDPVLRKKIKDNALVQKYVEQLIEMSNYFWTKVRSVKKTGKTKPCYDLSVPGPHSYHVNSIISHNSKDSVKMNAKEIYTSLKNSMTTLRSASLKLNKEGHFDVPAPVLLAISSPSSIHDMICYLYDRSKKDNSSIYGFRYSSLEFNPTLDEDMLKELAGDAVTYARDYLARPPMSVNAFINKKKAVLNCVSDEHENIIEVTQRIDYTKTGIKITAGNLHIHEMSNSLKSIPKLLTMDAGRNKNSFVGMLWYLKEEDDPLPGADPKKIPVVCGAFEVIPEHEAPINFNQLYNDVILPICNDLSVRFVAADQWQSEKLLNDLEEDVGCEWAVYSPKYSDFLEARARLYNGQVEFFAPEMPLKTAFKISRNEARYPLNFQGSPMVHMFLQALTVVDVPGKTVEKATALTDDLFRVYVLGSAIIDDEAVVSVLEASNERPNMAYKADVGLAIGSSGGGSSGMGGGSIEGVTVISMNNKGGGVGMGNMGGGNSPSVVVGGGGLKR